MAKKNVRTIGHTLTDEIHFLKETCRRIELPLGSYSNDDDVEFHQLTKMRFPNRDVFLDGYQCGLERRALDFGCGKHEFTSEQYARLGRVIARLKTNKKRTAA